LGFNITCPHCHKLFSVEKKQREIISETLIPRGRNGQNKEPIVGNYTGAAVIGDTIVRPSMLPQLSENVVVYKVHLRCKHCGHQWTETKEEAKAVGR
jgi:hypothetical protein